jgi:hypothetical protein
MPSRPLDNLDFLQELIDAPQEVERKSRTRKPKDIRDQTTWFRLNHNISGTCSQKQECLGLLLYDKGPGRVTSIVNEVEMCRICFLEGLAYHGD